MNEWSNERRVIMNLFLSTICIRRGPFSAALIDIVSYCILIECGGEYFTYNIPYYSSMKNITLLVFAINRDSARFSQRNT